MSYMNRFCLTTALLFFCTNLYAQSWTTQAPMKVKRSEASAVEYNGELYVFNGFSLGLMVGSSIEKYNPQSKQWTKIGTTQIGNATAVTHTGALLVGNEAWLIGGRVGSHPGKVSDKVWIYNLDTNKWRVGPKLPIPMAAGGAALVDNKIHFFGGVDTNAKCDVNFHYTYNLSNPAQGWKNITATAAMPLARNHFSTVELDDVIYAIGGQHGHDGCSHGPRGNVKWVHSFTPATNSWKKLADLPAIESHNEPSTFTHNGYIYTVGGATAGNKVLRFEPAKNKWEQITVLPERLLAPVARIYNGKLVVAGGGAPITAKSITTVRSLALTKFDDIAQGSNDTSNDNDNDNDNDNENDADENEDSDPTDPIIDIEGDRVIIAVEAESYTTKSSSTQHQWSTANLPNASASTSMVTTPNIGALKANANGSPALSYSIQFPAAGTYHFWVRGWGDENAQGNGVNDSIHAGINNQIAVTADKIDGFPTGWNWSKQTRDSAPATLTIPSTGLHTINLWMREDGLAVDQFLLVNDSTYVPQGATPIDDDIDIPNTPVNVTPIINAGPNRTITTNSPLSLVGSIVDDGLPTTNVTAQWSKVSGPGTVNFTAANNTATSATFTSAGTYLLRLTGDDGELNSTDTVSVLVVAESNDDTDNTDNTDNDNGSSTAIIVLEAENFQNKTGAGTHNWVNANYPTASGSASMISSPNTNALRNNASNSPMMAYQVNFGEPGNYHVWIRGWGDEKASGAGSNDSVHAGLNGTLSATADKIDGFPTNWHWSNRTRDGNSATISVPNTGIHTFNLWMREDGLAIDKIILTKDQSYVPSGLGSEPDDSTETANSAPTVSAGSSPLATVDESITLSGIANDDGKPTSTLSTLWSKVSGPGEVSFADANNASTTATINAPGIYLLQLTATDGVLSSSDTITVTVSAANDQPNEDLPSVLGIAIEAEDYFTKSATPTHQWINTNLAGASANASMITTPNSGALKQNANGSPMMAYLINFTEPGSYYLWVRGWGDERSNGKGGNDSLHAGINGSLSSTADNIDGFPKGWHWSKRTRDGSPAKITVPSAGTHTINIWMREDGLAIDKFILTKDNSYVPTGLGNLDEQGPIADNDSDNGSGNDNSETDNDLPDNLDGLKANANIAWEMVQSIDGSSVRARHEAGAVAVGSKLYMMGGRGNRPVQSYDTVTKKWTTHGNAPVLMHHFQPIVIGNIIYAIGAMKDDQYPTEDALEFVYEYNTTNNQWSRGFTIPNNRRRGSTGAAVYKGKIYIVGGNTNGHSGPAVNWFDEYDPATNQWSVLPNAPNARDHATIAVSNGKLVVAAGRRSQFPNVLGITEGKTDVFNFITNQWETSADDIPTKRAGTMTVAVGDEVIVIGGESVTQVQAHRDVEAFNVITGKWRKLQLLLEGRHSGGAALVNDKVHVVSGNTTRGGGNETVNHETLQLDDDN